jgi:chromosome segregation ATPase
MNTRSIGMKSTQLAIACLTLAALAVGCKPSSEPLATESQAKERQFDQVQQETKETTQAMNDYAYTQKAEYVATMETQLSEINRDLDLLAARIEKADDAAKAEARPRLEALRGQVATLNTHLDDARNATESTWDDVKAGFQQGYSELKDGFSQARQWVSEKIAP